MLNISIKNTAIFFPYRFYMNFKNINLTNTLSNLFKSYIIILLWNTSRNAVNIFITQYDFNSIIYYKHTYVFIEWTFVHWRREIKCISSYILFLLKYENKNRLMQFFRRFRKLQNNSINFKNSTLYRYGFNFIFKHVCMSKSIIKIIQSL